VRDRHGDHLLAGCLVDRCLGGAALLLAYLAATDISEMTSLLTPLAASAWALGMVWLKRPEAIFPQASAAVLTTVLNMLSHVPFGVGPISAIPIRPSCYSPGQHPPRCLLIDRPTLLFRPRGLSRTKPSRTDRSSP
jgi:hypothetical protein